MYQNPLLTLTTASPTSLLEEEEEEFDLQDNERICYCTEHCSESHSSCRTNGYCFALVNQLQDGGPGDEYEITYGCMPANEIALMQCRSNDAPHRQPKMIQCCNNGSLCNLGLQLKKPKMHSSTASPMLSYTESMQPNHTLNPTAHGHTYTAHTYLWLGGTLAFSLILIIFLILLIRWRSKLQTIRQTECNRKSNVQLQLPSFVWINLTANVPNQAQVSNHTSHSLLRFGRKSTLRRTANQCPCGSEYQSDKDNISRQIQLQRPLSLEGRYGQLYLGKRKGTEVAVRLLLNDHLRGWMVEKRLYQMPLIRHKNIIGMVAADCVQMANQRLHLLITDYHPYGSLQDLLKDRLVEERTAFKLIHSAARGLHHLHVSILNRQQKPQIAHMDIRSRNIIVKSDFTCAIANFRFSIDSENVNSFDWQHQDEQVKHKRKKCKNKPKCKNTIKNVCFFEHKECRVQMPFDTSEVGTRVQVFGQNEPEFKLIDGSLTPMHDHDEGKAQIDLLERNVSKAEVSNGTNDDTCESMGKCKMVNDLDSSDSQSEVSVQDATEADERRIFGCARYAAPELLDNSISSHDSIDWYKRADVYSFALVIWEVSRRCSSGGYCEQYQLPYHEYVGDDEHPAAVQMKHVVVTKNKRPCLNVQWFHSEHVQANIGPLVQSMWNRKPEARLTMLKVKKELNEMMNTL